MAPVAAVPEIVATSFGEVRVGFVAKAIVGTGPEALVIVIPAHAVKPVTSPVPNDCQVVPS